MNVMTFFTVRSVRLVPALALLAVGLGVQAAPADYAGRGIYHFASTSGCPFASAEQTECNRIVIDAPGIRASVDTDGHRIVFSSDTPRTGNDVLGDVLLQGSGVDDKGQRMPLSIQMLLRHNGKTWQPDIYARAPVRGKFRDIRIDPYRVSVREGESELDLLTPDKARALFERPSLRARLSSIFVSVWETNADDPSGTDITIGIGVGKLSTPVARIRFASPEPAGTEINRVLASGTWSVEFDVLSNRIPVWAARRQLFLFRLEDSPLLNDMHANGLHKGDRIELGVREGRGYLRVNDHEEAFAGAVASGQAFMQESFMGLIVGWHHMAEARKTK